MRAPAFRLPLLVALCGALLAAGCSTVRSRIEEKQSVFNALPPQQQAQIQQGIVDVGFTPDMVYMALGRPDETRTHTTGRGEELTWVYKAYYQDYRGTAVVGYRRFVYYDPKAKVYRVYHEPVERDIYQERVEERIRIVFVDGKVTTIEQVKGS